MYLDEIITAQKRGEPRGVTSVCSAHAHVVRQTLISCDAYGTSPLIEATCNQVNQFGGYTGMTPADFVRYVREIAQQVGFPFQEIMLGGDHLGPSAWQDEPADVAMEKAEVLIHDYVEAGFVKIHLDCSMPLATDPEGPLDVGVSAERTARLARVAEEVGRGDLRYVIGTEVPLPGGATGHHKHVQVTEVKDVQRAIVAAHEAYRRAGLTTAWERVTAVVVQPGVEYGDDFVLPYRPEAARELSGFIADQPMVYEAHSTDYQTPQALRDLVRDHFAILKVGPALTHAFREAVFALAAIENELVSLSEHSNIVSVLDEAMKRNPKYWAKYYEGDEAEQALKRKFSLSDRIRYYWSDPRVRQAFEKLVLGLSRRPLPLTLVERYAPDVCEEITHSAAVTPDGILHASIQKVLDDYAQACDQ